VPGIWKAGMIVLAVCLLASIVIAIVRLATIQTEILGAGFHDLPAAKARQYERPAGPRLSQRPVPVMRR
jgi:hypothetical protein